MPDIQKDVKELLNEINEIVGDKRYLQGRLDILTELSKAIQSGANIVEAILGMYKREVDRLNVK